MPLGPMMALSLWRLIALRKAKVSRRGKTKAVDLLEVNGLTSNGAFGRGRGRGRTNKGKGKGKTKRKIKRGKGQPERECQRKERGKVVCGQCSNCLDFGHWNRDCMVNQVSNKQEPIPPSQTTSTTTPVAKATPGATVGRVFQFGNAVSNPSSPTPPTSPISQCLCQERMVLFHDPEPAWTEVDGECDHEWVILDSGSNVRLLPTLYRTDGSSILGAGPVQNNRGGTLHTTGTKKAELIAVTTGG